MSDHERELLRQARVHRFHRGTWGDFWAAHREEVYRQFPDRQERADLVDRLQQAVLLGVSGERVEELPTPAVPPGLESTHTT
jgi:hypothetical protein